MILLNRSYLKGIVIVAFSISSLATSVWKLPYAAYFQGLNNLHPTVTIAKASSSSDDTASLLFPNGANQSAVHSSSSPPDFNGKNSTLYFVDSGVIFFYHLAKTGGTTIRNNMRSIKHVEVVHVKNKKQFETISQKMTAILNGTIEKTLFVELHAGRALPSIVELSPRMQKWHATSQHHHIPFFSFTLLREPLHTHVSVFLFFHGLSCKWPWCSKRHYKASQENLVKSITPNRLCASLAKGQNHIDSLYQNVTQKDCQQVEQLLKTDWNWVGTTEDLSNVTLPLLLHMLNQTFSNVPKSSNVSNRSHPIAVEKLSQETRETMEQMSALDAKLYKAFQHGRSSTKQQNYDI